ncbi:MAG: 2-oxoglutarate-acceptor oxidoreductase subunit OorD [Syntrophorhabdus sp. PtaU1.Bin002]|nr:MAG: 2-oxoglutarate-acceptor oxidoreductase subunit OorD [Syntrophorhabdus sp. PtaB.Bin006]OPY68608.1 MAG: 2-oxoglutarate-acceptor oxidoreductase subunit OorD [Syntrophorhabdus sp. PtaU1.Bin002]
MMKRAEVKETNNPCPVINTLECKACERCVLACPAKALSIGTELNERGYRYVVYAGSGCTGCGSCYYTCPEPNALEVHIPQTEKKEND